MTISYILLGAVAILVLSRVLVFVACRLFKRLNGKEAEADDEMPYFIQLKDPYLAGIVKKLYAHKG